MPPPPLRNPPKVSGTPARPSSQIAAGHQQPAPRGFAATSSHLLTTSFSTRPAGSEASAQKSPLFLFQTQSISTCSPLSTKAGRQDRHMGSSRQAQRAPGMLDSSKAWEPVGTIPAIAQLQTLSAPLSRPPEAGGHKTCL